jgi:hypothetical protein
VKDIHAATFANEFDKVFLHRLRPLRRRGHTLEKTVVAIVVAGLNHHIVAGKVRPPRRPRSSGGILRRGADGYVEFSRRFQNAAQQQRGLPPVVVAESIHDQYPYLALRVPGARRQYAGHQKAKQAQK